MRISLLHPVVDSRLQTHRSGNGHLGLAYLAAFLLQRGHEVHVLDAKNSCVTDNSLRRHIAEFQPDIFGVTAMTHEVYAATHACAVVKQAAPAIWTVIGGPHATNVDEGSIVSLDQVGDLIGQILREEFWCRTTPLNSWPISDTAVHSSAMYTPLSLRKTGLYFVTRYSLMIPRSPLNTLTASPTASLLTVRCVRPRRDWQHRVC